MAAGAAGGELRLASSEATQEELWRIQEGTVDAIPVPMKMRLADPTEWFAPEIGRDKCSHEIEGTGFHAVEGGCGRTWHAGLGA